MCVCMCVCGGGGGAYASMIFKNNCLFCLLFLFVSFCLYTIDLYVGICALHLFL